MLAILRMTVALLLSGALAILTYLVFSMFQFGSTPYPSEFEYRGSPSYKHTLVRDGGFTLTMCGQEICDYSTGNVRSISSVTRRGIEKLQAPFSYLPPFKAQDDFGQIIKNEQNVLDPMDFIWKWQINDMNRLEFIHYRKPQKKCMMLNCYYFVKKKTAKSEECIKMESGRCLPKT